MGFLFLMMKRDHCLYFKDFVTFLAIFRLDYGVKIAVAKKLL